jgi:amino acid transporter
MSPLTRIQTLLAKPFMPAVFFCSGVTYDTVTLTRIDRLQDNLLLLIYLLLLGVLIVLTGRIGIEPPPDRQQLTALSPVMRWFIQSRPYYPMASQFLLGGLFSAYAVFYSRSATLTSTAVFFGVLVLLLIGNEFLRDRLSNLRLLISLYALVCFGFFTFFLPVMTGYMNVLVFLAGAGLSAGVTFRVVQLIYRNNPDRSRKEALGVTVPAFALIVLLVGFYFLNWIPPVPLSMKFGGIYHEVKKSDDRFELSFERKWFQLWKRSDTTFPAHEPIYCFTAVFAPVALNTTVYHHWYFRPHNNKPFSHADRIAVKISGGREAGYRAYTFKQQLEPGDWRVDLEAEDGRIIGRVSVTVENREDPPAPLTTIWY